MIYISPKKIKRVKLKSKAPQHDCICIVCAICLLLPKIIHPMNIKARIKVKDRSNLNLAANRNIYISESLAPCKKKLFVAMLNRFSKFLKLIQSNLIISQICIP